jgi:hypothetical protein
VQGSPSANQSLTLMESLAGRSRGESLQFAIRQVREKRSPLEDCGSLIAHTEACKTWVGSRLLQQRTSDSYKLLSAINMTPGIFSSLNLDVCRLADLPA